MIVSGRLTRELLDAGALVLEAANPAHGALILFLGVVREVNDGRSVTGIEYTAYEAMAERELESIAREAGERFAPSSVVIVHRLGELALEDASVGIAVGHAHR